jgi:hypothetical protein
MTTTALMKKLLAALAATLAALAVWATGVMLGISVVQWVFVGVGLGLELVLAWAWWTSSSPRPNRRIT